MPSKTKKSGLKKKGGDAASKPTTKEVKPDAGAKAMKKATQSEEPAEKKEPAPKSKTQAKLAGKTKSASKLAHKLAKVSEKGGEGPPEEEKKTGKEEPKVMKKEKKSEKRKAHSKAIRELCENASVSPEAKEKLRQEAIQVIKAGLPSDQRPFVPDKWALKFKPALGSYRKFLLSLPEIFEVDGDQDKYHLRLKGRPEAAPGSTKKGAKDGPKATPAAPRKTSPPSAATTKAVVKKIVKKKGGKK
ncbi:unnamed protein product [Prorocentrum cordatum]|uniref:Uncharacterized protein n=1 Tax=Prorocentrum cordatum TaxID=2364126 RepID=A0ABN9Q764_9DINO|nr:unnamed protein product [Polarella glacialis]